MRPLATGASGGWPRGVGGCRVLSPVSRSHRASDQAGEGLHYTEGVPGAHRATASEGWLLHRAPLENVTAQGSRLQASPEPLQGIGGLGSRVSRQQ